MNNLINKIGLDKIAHFGLGGLICALFTFVFLLQDMYYLTPVQMILMPTIGSVVTFIVSLFKEYFFDSKPDWKDITAAMIGCGTVYIAVAIGVLFNVLSNNIV